MNVGEKFITKAPQDRKNSETQRRLLYDIVACDFSRSLERTCDAINAHLRRVKDPRDYDRPIKASSLQRVILDDYFITYAHLNAVAKLYGIPISLVLAFTRIRDELEDVEKRGQLDALRILTGMRAAIDHLLSQAREVTNSREDVLTHLGHSAFKDYVMAYKDHARVDWVQLDLPVDRL
jgi:hypothetical protein